MKTQLLNRTAVQMGGFSNPKRKSFKGFAFFWSMLLFMFMGSIAWAQPANDACSGAIPLTLGPRCTIGTNVGATIDNNDTVGGPSCWLSDSNATVWFTFTTGVAGNYSISTNNGTNDFDADAQLKLYSGTCGVLTRIGCNDDLVNPDNAHNTLASIITSSLLANTTYYIAVDIFGDSEGQFCINVYKDTVAENDCINNVVSSSTFDLTSTINTLSSSTPVVCNPYFYNAPSDGMDLTTNPGNDPVNDGSGSPLPGGCNGTTPETQQTYFGVWFKFEVTASGPKDAWLSAYANNSDNLYTLTLFKATGTPNQAICGTSLIDSLTQIDCSTADGLATNGGDRDKSKTSNFDHPRIDISGLSTGWYYVRAAQFTRVLIDTNNTAQPAPPSEGIFNLCFEAPQRVSGLDAISIDGLSNDSCNLANAISGSYTGLTNAGAIGNTYVANGGTTSPTPDSNKPAELTASANSGTYNKNCDPANSFIASVFQKDVNNPAIYAFSINDGVANQPPSSAICTTVDSFIAILRATDIDPLLNGKIDTLADTLQKYVDILCALPVDDAVNEVKGTVCGVLQMAIDQSVSPAKEILQQIKDILCDGSGLVTACVSNVDIKIDNINSFGANGDRLFAFVLPATTNSSSQSPCASPQAVMTGLTSSTDGCLEMFNSAPLSNGDYYLVIDGENGQLLTYDLDISITQADPISGLPCNSVPRVFKSNKVSGSNMVLNYLKPVPASDRVEISYNSTSESASSIIVHDVAGKLIYSEKTECVKGDNVRSLNISTFAKGVYIITIQNGNQKLYSKFVKIDQ